MKPMNPGHAAAFGVAIAAAAVFAAAASASPSPGPPGGADEKLRAELLRMAEDDQEAIRLGEADARAGKPQTHESAWIHEVHRRNGANMHRIVEERGWPGRSLAGDDGAAAAWLVVQHMDEEPQFQRRCLTLMEAAFINGDVSARNLAFLTDRVLDAEGKPQKYGTQGIGVKSPEDEARIDRNRAAIGLPPWREFVQSRRREHETLEARDAGGAAATPGTSPGAPAADPRATPRP